MLLFLSSSPLFLFAQREIVNPVHRALWGLIRTARTEYPSRLLVLIDLPSVPTPEDDVVLTSLCRGDINSFGDELAVRDGRLFAAHIARASISAPLPSSHKKCAYELVQDSPGQLAALTYKQSELQFDFFMFMFTFLFLPCSITKNTRTR